MKRISAKTRITIGQMLLLFGILMCAMLLNIVPDNREYIVAGRAALCEAVAVNGSALVTSADERRLEAILKVIVARNPELLSAGVRRKSGTLVVDVAGHATAWSPLVEGQSTDSQIQVPIWAGQKQWGGVEFRFQPLRKVGALAWLQTPRARHTAFVLAAMYFAFNLYLGKMLEQLNPSKAEPQRTLNALDTSSEGESESSETKESPSSSERPVEHKSRILVVDDGESNRQVLSIVLEQSGVLVDTADNGRVAVNMANRSAYDAILMDMQMPVMDGYAATRTLREQGHKTPIIALTANAMEGAEEKCRAAGCSGFLTKPVNIDNLVSCLAETLGGTGISESPPNVDRPSENSSNAAGDRSALTSSLPIDDPVFQTVVGTFVDRLNEQLCELRNAFRRSEFEEVARLAHWVKGAGGTVGFHDFTEPAARLLTLARERQAEKIDDAIAQIEDLASRIVIPSRQAVHDAAVET